VSALAVCLLIYAVVALLALRPLAGHYAYRLGGPERGPDWLQGSALAAIAVVVWPVALLPWALFALSGRLKIGAERAALEQQGQLMRQRHVQQLERDLGLDDDSDA
jgi:hypothetical protein